jgi:hypothetical protein
LQKKLRDEPAVSSLWLIISLLPIHRHLYLVTGNKDIRRTDGHSGTINALKKRLNGAIMFGR